ncbi:MAG: hypothetical protein V7647_4155 [Acidobacteriota bacterium]
MQERTRPIARARHRVCTRRTPVAPHEAVHYTLCRRRAVMNPEDRVSRWRLSCIAKRRARSAVLVLSGVDSGSGSRPDGLRKFGGHERHQPLCGDAVRDIGLWYSVILRRVGRRRRRHHHSRSRVRLDRCLAGAVDTADVGRARAGGWLRHIPRGRERRPGRAARDDCGWRGTAFRRRGTRGVSVRGIGARRRPDVVGRAIDYYDSYSSRLRMDGSHCGAVGPGDSTFGARGCGRPDRRRRQSRQRAPGRGRRCW